MGVQVHVKVSSGGKFTIELDLSQTVGEAKEKLAETSQVPAAQQRLIYKGRVLKDEQTLASYGLEADHTIHLVRGGAPPASAASTQRAAAPVAVAQPAPGTDPAPAGLGGLGLGMNSLLGQDPQLGQMQQQILQNPNMMREMMSSPAVQSLLDNPELMRGIVMANPQLREILDRNPELNHVLNDPSMMRQTFEAARNPELMREMMRTTDRAMSNLEAHPEGFNMLRRMYETVQEPLMSAATQQAGQGAAGNATNQEGSTAASAPAGPAPNTAPLPNPWGPPQARSGAAATGTPGAAGGAGAAAGLGAGGFPDVGLGLGLGGGGMGSPAQMMQMLQDPAMQQVMQTVLSNPQVVQQMINMNPQLRALADANPQFREMVQNPEFVRTLSSPETLQQMMQLQSILGGLGGAGGLGGLGGGLGPGFGGSAQRDGTGGGGAGAPDLGAFLSMFGGQPAAQSNLPPEERFATQLQQLQDMGFFDQQENIRALLASNGNVNAAVERLLAGPG